MEKGQKGAEWFLKNFNALYLLVVPLSHFLCDVKIYLFSNMRIFMSETAGDCFDVYTLFRQKRRMGVTKGVRGDCAP